MIKRDVGHKAGYIWKLLNERGALTIKEIREFTEYNDLTIYLALGWLLRENKIHSSMRKNELAFGLNHQTPELFY